MTPTDTPPTRTTWPATWHDARGLEHATLHNDGQTLRIHLRGVDFEGSDLDMLEPAPDTPPALLGAFTLAQGDLCDGTLAFTLPLPLTDDPDALLHATLILGAPRPLPRGGIDREELQLRLTSRERAWTSPGTSGWFEDELLAITRQLPSPTAARCCLTCGLSDYNPCGHGLFGGLACFRDAADDYLRVDSKQAIFALWPRLTALVQETWCCPQHRPRPPHTGYRG